MEKMGRNDLAGPALAQRQHEPTAAEIEIDFDALAKAATEKNIKAAAKINADRNGPC